MLLSLWDTQSLASTDENSVNSLLGARPRTLSGLMLATCAIQLSKVRPQPCDGDIAYEVLPYASDSGE